MWIIFKRSVQRKFPLFIRTCEEEEYRARQRGPGDLDSVFILAGYRTCYMVLPPFWAGSAPALSAGVWMPADLWALLAAPGLHTFGLSLGCDLRAGAKGM